MPGVKDLVTYKFASSKTRRHIKPLTIISCYEKTNILLQGYGE